MPPLIQSNEPYFIDEPPLTAELKGRILRDWQRFYRNGFRLYLFSRELYNFLHREAAFIPHQGRETFWCYYFAADLDSLRIFLAQFGSSHKRSAEYGTPAWLDGPAADLKQAMCRELEQLIEPLWQVLDDLERGHREMVIAWGQFAHRAGLPEVEIAPRYMVDDNTRNLLAYAAHIALKQRQLLPALQMEMPLFMTQETDHASPIRV